MFRSIRHKPGPDEVPGKGPESGGARHEAAVWTIGLMGLVPRACPLPIAIFLPTARSPIDRTLTDRERGLRV